MKKSFIVILFLAGLLIPVKQTSAQHLPKISDLKNREIPFKRSNEKSGKKERNVDYFSKIQKSGKQKAADMTYIEVTSLPYTRQSTLDENSYLLEDFWDSYAEGYEITLTKGQIIQTLLRSDDFDCYLFVLDSNFNPIMENDDIDYENGDSNSRIILNALYTGVHYIIATGYDEETGDYTISIDNYFAPLSSQAYYVDAVNGDNSYDGLTTTTAKQSIQSVLETFTNGTIYIMNDILLDSTIVMEDGFVICLAPYNNGNYTIKRSEACADDNMIELWGSMLYLSDDAIGGTLTLDGGYSDTAASPVITDLMILYVDEESAVLMYSSITVQNNFSTYIAPAVYNKGLFYMYGGTIANNIGEIYNAVHNSGNFTMFDGIINNNYSDMLSGVFNMGTFNMHGGTISDNIAVEDYSGMTNVGDFSMYGGSISNNSAQYSSGICNEGDVSLYGGTISNNVAEIFSGILNEAYLTMYAGDITNNQADMAAGITNYDFAIVLGGTISDNEATTMSSGVINEEDGMMMLFGGTISGNISSGYPNQGITQVGTFCSISYDITIGNDNQIFLLEGTTINVNGQLPPNQKVGTIMPFKFDDNDEPDYAHRTGLKVLSGTQATILADYTKFDVADDGNGNEWFIDSEGKLYSSVSVSDFTKESSLQIFPNPTTDIINIQLGNIDLEQTVLNIYDMYGKLIQEVEIDNGYKAVNVEHLSNGVYFMQLFNKGQVIDSRKIIKQ
jgi:hypothetical protein